MSAEEDVAAVVRCCSAGAIPDALAPSSPGRHDHHDCHGRNTNNNDDDAAADRGFQDIFRAFGKAKYAESDKVKASDLMLVAIPTQLGFLEKLLSENSAYYFTSMGPTAGDFAIFCALNCEHRVPTTTTHQYPLPQPSAAPRLPPTPRDVLAVWRCSPRPNQK